MYDPASLSEARQALRLAEEHINGGMVGTTFWVVLHEQFDRLQEGDRFYYLDRVDGFDFYQLSEEQSLADIVARNVSVSGAVTGKIRASNRLEILSTGRVWGDVEVGSFLLDEDGYFRGELVMREEPELPPQLAKTPPDRESGEQASD